MNRIPLHAAVWLLCALISGCAALGLATPQTVSQKLSYAYGQNAGLRTAAANSLTAGTLAVEDAEFVLKTSDNVRTLLDSTKLAINSGDPKTAEGRLLLALNVLDQLNAYLSQKVKP